MVFSIEGGVTHARDTVNRALAELSRREMALPWLKFTVSSGIAGHDGADTDFRACIVMRTPLCIRPELRATVH